MMGIMMKKKNLVSGPGEARGVLFCKNKKKIVDEAVHPRLRRQQGDGQDKCRVIMTDVGGRGGKKEKGIKSKEKGGGGTLQPVSGPKGKGASEHLVNCAKTAKKYTQEMGEKIKKKGKGAQKKREGNVQRGEKGGERGKKKKKLCKIAGSEPRSPVSSAIPARTGSVLYELFFGLPRKNKKAGG